MPAFLAVGVAVLLAAAVSLPRLSGAGGTKETAPGDTTTRPSTPPETTSAALPRTFQGQGYGPEVASPSKAQPQSKLWWHDGSWWVLMVDPSGSGIHVFELLPDHTWRNTGAVADERASSTGDALWDGAHLYVASRTGNGALHLVRFSYEPAARTYTTDPGFPAVIAGGGAASLAIAKDGTGVLWVTYAQRARVWVAHTIGDDTSWAPPFHPPGADVDVTLDDVSAIASVGGEVVVMWSDQGDGAFRFVSRTDGTPPDRWSPPEMPLQGTNMADGHINMAAGTDGRLYVAVKTSQGDGGEPATSPLVAVLTRSSAGTWSTAVAGTVADRLTRPMIQIDEANEKLYFFATAPDSGSLKQIYLKTAPLPEVSFGFGRGVPFVASPGANINDPSGAKHPVDATTGLVVLASDETAHRYYHAELALAGGSRTSARVLGAASGLAASAASPAQASSHSGVR